MKEVEKIYTDNKIDNDFYSEKSLYLLNIKELRDLGRKFGVPHPTTMKKKDLVEYILKVVYGEVSTPIKSSVGRPSKRDFDLDKCLRKIEKNVDVSGKLKAASLENFGVMKVANFEGKSEVKEIETRIYFEEDGKCYLKVHQFVKSNKDYEIPKEVANKLSLKNYDVVEVIIFDDMFKIISVNLKKVSGTLDDLVICDNRLFSGTKRDFYLSTKEEIKEKIDNLSKDFEEKGTKLIVLGTKNYSGKTTSCITYDLSEDKASLYKKLVYLIGICENAILENADFLLVFEDANEVEKIANSFEGGVSERIKKYLRSALSKIAALGNIIALFRCDVDKKY